MDFIKYSVLHGNIQVSEKTEYINFHVGGYDMDSEIIFANSDTPPTYEPYKSNILTVNEEVELRGIGDVKDTLDCLTGEATERIGEIVLDGTQNFSVGTSPHGNPYFIYVFNGSKGNGISLSDKFQTYTDAKFFSSEYRNGLCLRANGTGFNISFADDTIKTNSQAKAYLQQNPVTVQYQLATEVIKTVDLTVVNQDNQPTQLGTFENITHVSLEAENLIPEVEMEVATRISEELASASPLMDDISTKQEQLNTTVDEQSENVDATMVATTEIYEETL